MKTTTRLLLALALMGLGCGGGSDDAAVDVPDSAGKADGVTRPVGTYRNDGAANGQFAFVVLKSDTFFHRAQVVTCVAAPCNPAAQFGSYAFTKSGNTQYIRFNDNDGNLVDRYAYRLDGDQLSLRAVDAAGWQKLTLTADQAFCAEAADCEIQELPQPRCPGRWRCLENTCEFGCGANDCEIAGGTCVGLAPGSCVGGVVADASAYGCGDGVGLQCCVSCDACKPVCDSSGEEGWYNPCTLKLLCPASCFNGSAPNTASWSWNGAGWHASGAGCDGNLISSQLCAE
jgi:hypothetical protein